MTEKELLTLVESWDTLSVVLTDVDKYRELVPLLVDFALYNEHPHSWRVAYLIDKIHDLHPELIRPYLPKMIEKLKIETHHGKRRHWLKLISMNEIDEKYFGLLVDFCLSMLTSSKELPAVRVHAMQILFNISQVETDLQPEILAVIEHEMEYHSTPGIRSRGTKLAKKLARQIRGREGN